MDNNRKVGIVIGVIVIAIFFSVIVFDEVNKDVYKDSQEEINIKEAFEEEAKEIYSEIQLIKRIKAINRGEVIIRTSV